MGLFSFLKKKKPEGKIPTPPSPPGSVPKPAFPEKPSESSQPVPSVPQPGDKSRPPVPPSQSNVPDIPSIPKPSRNEAEDSVPQPKAPRAIDDFGIPAKESFDLPDIEMPKFDFPNKSDKEEISRAVESKQKPEKKPEKKAVEPAPEIPDIGEETESPFFAPEEPEETAQQEKVPQELPEIGEEDMGMEIEAPSEMVDMKKAKGPVFIRGDRFMAAKKGLNDFKDNLKKLDDVFSKMNDLKNKEDAEIDVWQSSVEAIQRKLVYIDRTVFEE
ncbi:hypothetical protein GF345_03895 [Candidatus Woesearchaeota archaeon]|nr:hypothetical protein [Candidatus Woesearchaeota archaeon]